jgi:hypothetical protein
MSQPEDQFPTTGPTRHNATDHGLQRMLDLPTELCCYIPKLLVKDKYFDTYYALLEHPEIGKLVYCNFHAQFRAIKRHRYLASQLQQILTTIALLSTHTKSPRSSGRIAQFLSALRCARNGNVDVPKTQL